MAISRKALAKKRVAYSRLYRGRGYRLGAISKSLRQKALAHDVYSPRRQRMEKLRQFNLSIQPTWPGTLILKARRAIAEEDYLAYEEILATLQTYNNHGLSPV